jgi:protein-tyrosine phosphatase
MFSFFKKKTQVEDLEWLGVDIHSHLLPGIDDGSPDIDTSIHLIKELNELGYSKFFCTPHIFTELYPNNPQTILPALDKVKIALKHAHIEVEINAAAEHMIDETFRINDELLSLPGKHILIEMSFLSEVPNIEKVIFDLQIAGYNVILAHPERYNFYHKDTQKFHRLKEMGVLFQLNLLAVTGYYGKEVKLSSEFLLENRLYDLAGTDLHHVKHLKALSSSVRNGSMYRKLGHYPFKNKELFL